MWRAVLAMLALALGLGLLVGWLRPADGAARPAAAVLVLAAAVPAAVPASNAVARVAHVQLAAPQASAPDTEFIEVCGVGRRRRSEPASDWLPALDVHFEQALAALLPRLDAGTPGQRVAAAVLRDDTERAAQLAAFGSDVEAYRIALRACRKDAMFRRAAAQVQAQRTAPAVSGITWLDALASGPAPTACVALSLERLEALDGADAWPWLLRLSDSMEHGDGAGVTQALHQIGQRDWPQMRVRPLSAAVARLVGDEPTLHDTLAMVQAVGKEAAGLLDGLPATIARACRPEALKDANRRQSCEQAVRRMPGMAAELIDARMLHALEERLGLPHSPQAMGKDERERATRVLSDTVLDMADDPGCAHVSRIGKRLSMLAGQGELAYVRARLKETVAN